MYPHIPVIIVDYATVKLEPHAGLLWVHCDVTKLSPSIFKDMDKQWNKFTAALNQDLYVLYDPDLNVPSKRYIEHFGFSFLKNIQSKRDINKTYQIWKRNK